MIDLSALLNECKALRCLTCLGMAELIAAAPVADKIRDAVQKVDIDGAAEGMMSFHYCTDEVDVNNRSITMLDAHSYATRMRLLRNLELLASKPQHLFFVTWR